MSKVILQDLFDRANTSSGLGSDWLTVAAGGGAQTVIQGGKAELRSYPTAGLHLVSAFYTGSGRTNLIARTSVDATLPTNFGDYEYNVALLSGYILPADWVSIQGNLVAGYGVAYDTSSGAAVIFYQLANGTLQTAAAALYTWNPGETKTLVVQTSNDAITDVHSPYYGTYTLGQPYLIRIRAWIDGTEIVGTLPVQLYAPSLANPFPGGAIPGRSLGTYDGISVVTQYGTLSTPVQGGGFVKFDNFRKTDLISTPEPTPTCRPQTTRTSVTVDSDEITTPVILPSSLFPDRVYQEEREYAVDGFETELGYVLSYTQDNGGRIRRTWQWTGLTESQKDSLEAILDSAYETRGGIEFADPDFATTNYWTPLEETYDLSLVQAGLFEVSIQVIDARYP